MKTFKHPKAMSVEEVSRIDKSRLHLKESKILCKILLGQEVVGTKLEYETLLLCPSHNWGQIADPDHIYSKIVAVSGGSILLESVSYTHLTLPTILLV